MTFAATILTLYPEMFPGPLGVSLAGRALSAGRWSLRGGANPGFRDRQASYRRRHARGRRCGNGAACRCDRGGARFGCRRSSADRADAARETADAGAHSRDSRRAGRHPFVAAGSRGSTNASSRVAMSRRCRSATYILSGGEMGALVLLDACIRLLPGVMGAAYSGVDESFETGLLEYPHYTRPVTWEGRTIPEVLRSGDHARIEAWRRAQAETDTRLRRPDLWERHDGARVGSPSGARREDERR